MLQIAVLVAANSHLSIVKLRQALGRRLEERTFTLEHVDSQLDLYHLNEGIARASTTVMEYLQQCDIPLCIGVIAVNWRPPQVRQWVRQELAVTLERGSVRPYRLLASHCAHLALTAEEPLLKPNEAHYSKEGIKTLVARILQRSKVLKLA